MADLHSIIDFVLDPASSGIAVDEVTFTPADLLKDGTTSPDTKFSTVYESSAGVPLSPPVPIFAWKMTDSSSSQEPLTVVARVPTGINVGAGASVDIRLHFVLRLASAAGVRVRFQARSDYKSSGEDIGPPPAGPFPGFEQTSDSEIVVSEPPNANQLRHFEVIISAGVSGVVADDFLLISFDRIAPAGGAEYADEVFVVAAAYRFRRT